MDSLREILGVMARQSERRMLLGRWGGNCAPNFLITPHDAAVARSPDFEPIVEALPDGALLAPEEKQHTVNLSATAASDQQKTPES